ncbi:hypothetical protein [Thermophagus xiamenensis]|uniref:Uncharacterized protein n=1 Tax=Thermophagus xiamenensis TaxID=385682 RepID=A0A1I1VRY7_9BACT|nr:hypothetical protein [Thermophagus xiamenensis]SFD85681.1 hypothetical protein SAMN05444380_10335 [Thermophagus xiamenensis]
MTKTLKLFRADKKNNTTRPEKFATDGLLSKQINGGDPLFFNYGWTKQIKNHIEGVQNIFETTSFLSFSENEKLVRNYYLKGNKEKEVESSSFDEAEAYIFSANFEKKQLQEIYDGIYFFEYKCNYQRFKEYLSFKSAYVGCETCNKIPNYKHRLLIINAVTFLSKLNNKNFNDALKNAQRDAEWLLMPIDPMLDGTGFQSRIPVADFWDVKFFKYSV